MAATPTLKRAAGNNLSTTLASGISNSATSITVADASGFSADGGYIIIDATVSAKREIIYYESVSGSVLTVASDGRGREGTVAVAHDAGATINDVLVQSHIDDLVDSFELEHDQDGGHKQLSSAIVLSGTNISSTNKVIDKAYLIDAGGWYEGDFLTPIYHAADVVRFENTDVTHLFPAGSVVRYKQGGAYQYKKVTASSYSTHTDLTVSGNDYTLANSAITNFAVTYNPSTANGCPFTITNLRAYAYRDSAANYSTGAKITFDTEVYDPNSNFASGDYTAPVDGMYTVEVGVGVVGAGLVSGKRVGYRLDVDSVGQVQPIYHVSAATDSRVTGSHNVYLTAGAVVNAVFLHDVGGSIALSVGAMTNTYIKVTYLG